MAKVLVVGGAGYVGGASCAWLLDHGHEIWVLDDLSTGHRELVERLKGVRGFVRARAGDAGIVAPFLARERFDCVMHFAASSLVAESVAQARALSRKQRAADRSLLDRCMGRASAAWFFRRPARFSAIRGPGVSVSRVLAQKPDQSLRRHQARGRAHARIPGARAGGFRRSLSGISTRPERSRVVGSASGMSRSRISSPEFLRRP